MVWVMHAMNLLECSSDKTPVAIEPMIRQIAGLLVLFAMLVDTATAPC